MQQQRGAAARRARASENNCLALVEDREKNSAEVGTFVAVFGS
jgi:hypothetical protein